MTPDCCKRCSHLTADGNCRTHGKSCTFWREWFSMEWANIRQATENIKKERNTNQ